MRYVLFSLILGSLIIAQGPAEHREMPVAFSSTVDAGGGASLRVDFAEGPLDLPRNVYVTRIQRAVEAVNTYYGRFPVKSVRILILPVAERHGILQGTTWGDRDGFPAFLRLRIGQKTSSDELASDWVITHELVHTALASLPDEQHWLEEGIASYVEPIARVQAGQMPAARIWADMMRGMPNGEPQPGDQGLNHTHTWGRTYWGGALFCLQADIEIRRETQNRKGLQDALRAVMEAGGTIDHEWPIARILRVGDQATGTHVLSSLYERFGESPATVDLPALWESLGVREAGGTVRLFDNAPLAATRNALTAPVERKRNAR